MQEKPWRHLYKKQLWRKGRLVHLMEQPLCQRCAREGRIREASVVHHIEAHRGDWLLFSNPGNWESLCKSCHDSIEQSIEARGYDRTVATDGWPQDKTHPLYGQTQAAPRLPTHMPRPKCRCVIVYGAPGAGKSTLLRWLAMPGDVIADIDREERINIALPERNELVTSARHDQLCWITAAAPRLRDREAWSRACNDRALFVEVTADRQTCYKRRPRYRKEIDAWFCAYEK